MAIVWLDSMSTGVPEIDEQHKQLIEKLNVLGETMLQGKGQDHIKEILDFTIEYADQHFQYEEDCMNKYNCPIAKANKSAHEKFIKDFDKLREQASQPELDFKLILKVHRELSEWFLNHIWKIDTQLRSCVNENEEK